MKKVRKILSVVSAIALNVFAVLLGIIVLISSLSSIKAVESLITVNFFGGYRQKTEEVGEGEEDTAYFKSEFSSIAELNEHNKGVCQDVEAEGAVLLKNNNDSLPLASNSKVSLFGVTSVKPIYTVDAGADKIGLNGDEPNYLDVFTEVGLTVNPGLYSWYKTNYETYKNPVAPSNFQPVGLRDAKWTEIPESERNSFSEYNDATIFIIGRGGNEGVDMQINGGSSSTYTDGDFLQLSVAEKTVLDELKSLRRTGAIHNLVIIINSAAPLETNLMDSSDVDSILWVGMTGTSGVKAVADILVGNVNPSGRLSDMWYVNNCYDPVLTNYGDFTHDSSRKYVVYQEGMYLGYRYAETRYEDIVLGTQNAGNFDYSAQIAYPFGYGLSYTEFEYSKMNVTYNEKRDEYTVSVTVTNTGNKDGKEVVQVYLQQPYTDYDRTNHIEKPSVELVGFEKTGVLAAGGGHEEVKVVVEGKYFASYDAYGIGSYYRDEGTYYLTVGKDAHAAINNILSAKGKTAADGMTESGDTALVNAINLAEDATTYKTASNTGYEVKNLFDNADPNRWGADGGSNHVDWMTRANWADTVKLAYDINHKKTNNLQQTITNCKVIEDGRALDSNGGVAATYGTGRNNDYPTYEDHREHDDPEHLNLIDLRTEVNAAGEEVWIDYEDERWDKLLDQLSWDETVQIVSNGLRNTQGLSVISKPLTIDHNGSSGFYEPFNYLEGTEDKPGANRGLAVKNNDPDKDKRAVGYPCSGIIAATFNKELAYEVGKAIGEDSIWSGKSGLYGFGLNLHRSAYHGRYAAYYSADSYLTGVIAGYSSLGAWEKGCYVYNKHLVMNDQEVNREQFEGYIYEEAIRQMYLRPFEIAIDIGDAMCVMTSFNRVGAVWSGNHYNLCTEFLRKEAGMRGFAVTDWYNAKYMGMAGGVLAGNDLPDGDGEDGEFKDYGPGKGYAELAWAMRESAHRILFTVVHSNAMNGFGTGTRVRVLTPEWIGTVHTLEITFGVLFAVSAAAYITMWCLNKFLPEKPKAEASSAEEQPEQGE